MRLAKGGISIKSLSFSRTQISSCPCAKKGAHRKIKVSRRRNVTVTTDLSGKIIRVIFRINKIGTDLVHMGGSHLK